MAGYNPDWILLSAQPKTPEEAGGMEGRAAQAAGWENRGTEPSPAHPAPSSLIQVGTQEQQCSSSAATSLSSESLRVSPAANSQGGSPLCFPKFRFCVFSSGVSHSAPDHRDNSQLFPHTQRQRRLHKLHRLCTKNRFFLLLFHKIGWLLQESNGPYTEIR